MVNRLVVAVTGQKDLARAWSSLISPNDKVGIKISAAGGGLFTTHRDVVNAIVDGVVSVGVPRHSIVVWDRSITRVQEAGYRPGAEGYQMKAIAPRDGYDPKAIFTGPIAGKLIWGDLDFRNDQGLIPLNSEREQISNESHFARIVSSEVTKIINVPVMSDNAMSGLAGCLYNVTVPNIDNWRRFAQPDNFGAVAIVELFDNQFIGKKVVLNLMDGLVAQYAGGPQSQPNFSVHHATLLASKDPVAIDAIALQRIEDWRKKAAFPPAGRLAGYLTMAAQAGLGIADPARIEIRNVDR